MRCRHVAGLLQAALRPVAADGCLVRIAAFKPCCRPLCRGIQWQFEQDLSQASNSLQRCLQVVALLYYALSYFPGGSTGVRFVLNLLISGFWQCCLTVQKAVFK